MWWLVRLPVAVPDFHVVAHHDDGGAGECLYHEHLNRWHTPDDVDAPMESDRSSASLHWHWIFPGASVPDPEDASETDPFGPELSVVAQQDRRDALAALSHFGQEVAVRQAAVDPSESILDSCLSQSSDSRPLLLEPGPLRARSSSAASMSVLAFAGRIAPLRC
jgi:hypothetical protein